MKLLADKYAPTSFDEWMENDQSIAKLMDWIASGDNDWLIISGEPGSGKSHVLPLIAKEADLNVYTIPSNQSRSNQRITQLVMDLRNIKGLFVMDDFELFFTNSDSVNVNELFKIFSMEGFIMRLIIVIDSLHLSKLVKLLPDTPLITFCRPSKATLLAKCRTIMNKEGIPYDICRLDAFITANKCDVRYVLNALQLYNATDCVSTLERISLYDAYRQCIDPTIALHQRIRVFGVDSGSIPIICHENYLDFSPTLSDVKYISNSMAWGDIFHKNTFSTATDINNGVYACLSTIATSSICKKQSSGFINPKFGLIWTKQAAKYQKLKYLREFLNERESSPMIDVYELYVNHAYLKLKVNTDTFVAPLMEAFQTTNVTHLHNLYNGFSYAKPTLTKKAFVTKVRRLMNEV